MTKTHAPIEPSLLTKADLASRWQTTTRNIDRLVQRGRIAKIALGPRFIRFRLTDIEAAERQHRTKTVMEGLLGVPAIN